MRYPHFYLIWFNNYIRRSEASFHNVIIIP